MIVAARQQVKAGILAQVRGAPRRSVRIGRPIRGVVAVDRAVCVIRKCAVAQRQAWRKDAAAISRAGSEEDNVQADGGVAWRHGEFEQEIRGK